MPAEDYPQTALSIKLARQQQAVDREAVLRAIGPGWRISSDGVLVQVGKKKQKESGIR